MTQIDPILDTAPDLVRPQTNGLTTLTGRERDVLRHTARGETNAQIAARLGITVHAVKFHMASIFRKLDVANRTTAAAVYLAHPDHRDG